MSQHMDALAYGNEIRMARATLKRRVRMGEIPVADILHDLPPEAQTMPVSVLLMAQHRWARIRARRFLRSVGISDFRPLASLTARERERIVKRLAETEGYNPPPEWPA